jgi:hypothetical protein
MSKGAQVLLETARIRDACILLGKGRLYREFPAEWYGHYLLLRWVSAFGSFLHF